MDISKLNILNNNINHQVIIKYNDILSSKRFSFSGIFFAGIELNNQII